MTSNDNHDTDQWATDDDRFEWTSREEIRSVQEEKLHQQIQWVYDRSPFWRERFDTASCDPQAVTSVEDLSNVPFGTKTEYRMAQTESPPYGGLLCRDERDIHADGGFVWETSGTTGEPIKFLCSQDEYYRSDVAATERILRIAGLDAGDTVAMFWPLTLWAVGHGIIDAARRMNVTVLPLGPSYSTDYRVQKLIEYRPDVIMTTPTYALRLAEVTEEEDVDSAELDIDRAIVSGEPLPDATREAISSQWDLDGAVYNYYGLSEAFNCRSIECEKHDGIHVLEDLYLCQVVDPNGVEPVEPGETGELVVTALEQRDIATGFHYRTGDLAQYTDETCACGRTTRRIEILSRKDDMKTVRGVNVYPQAVESVVRDMDALTDEFRLRIEEDGALDRVTVVTELDETVVDGNREAIRDDIERSFERAFGGLSVDVEFVSPGSLERFDFKPDRWIDAR